MKIKVLLVAALYISNAHAREPEVQKIGAYTKYSTEQKASVFLQVKNAENPSQGLAELVVTLQDEPAQVHMNELGKYCGQGTECYWGNQIASLYPLLRSLFSHDDSTATFSGDALFRNSQSACGRVGDRYLKYRCVVRLSSDVLNVGDGSGLEPKDERAKRDSQSLNFDVDTTRLKAFISRNH